MWRHVNKIAAKEGVVPCQIVYSNSGDRNNGCLLECDTMEPGR